jgi:hypothetical protein
LKLQARLSVPSAWSVLLSTTSLLVLGDGSFAPALASLLVMARSSQEAACFSPVLQEPLRQQLLATLPSDTLWKTMAQPTIA